MLNGTEAADYQSATSFYNGSIEAQAFTDIEYLGNGVYRIPDERYKYCFTEQYLQIWELFDASPSVFVFRYFMVITPSGTS